MAEARWSVQKPKAHGRLGRRADASLGPSATFQKLVFVGGGTSCSYQKPYSDQLKSTFARTYSSCMAQMKVLEHELKIGGRVVKTAALAADTYEFVDNPDAVIRALHQCEQRIDLFTF